MTTLAEILSLPGKRDAVIADCCALLDAELGAKTGLSGVVLRAGYGALKGIRPGAIRAAVDTFLDEWVAKLEPFWAAAQERGVDPAEHLDRERAAVAEALLSVTDGRAEKAKKGLVRSTYAKLRPSAKTHVEQAIDGLAQVLVRHAR
ncbi:MAG: hypothetical protein HY744_16860 [Deltaproteobacteria bacterium]|nr:hypothetical protein [Deltaproteobacteria bacterium]